ncbi:MAG: 30S ribosomal protein S9 [Candidatus Paceibacterota bacterium]
MAGKSAGREKYFEAVGRRKTSIARVRLYTKQGDIVVNDKDYSKYFPTLRLQKAVISPIKELSVADKVGVTAKVQGGGINSQAGAVRLGISRALVLYNANFRKPLRKVGYLTRDARAVERKKYGLKKARRAPQWKKR